MKPSIKIIEASGEANLTYDSDIRYDSSLQYNAVGSSGKKASIKLVQKC